MNKSKRNWRKILVITSIIIAVLIGGGYLFLEYLKSKIVSNLTGCKLESNNFHTIIDFEYVSNWITIDLSVDGSDKKFPFLFDTGAQTIFLDSLLNEIGEKNFTSMSFGNKHELKETAFNNELISLNGISMGGVRFTDIGGISAKNSKWAMLNCISPYGIFGYNIIQNCSFQIDYDKQQITITDNVKSFENYEEIVWVEYVPASTQESPIIKVIVNDTLELELMFDTGNSGGIDLFSSKLYHAILEQYPENTVKYISRPSLLIRGEKDEINESLIFHASEISIGNDLTKNMNIRVNDSPEREYDGLIGNKYFENYIITLDYDNRRIGFIKQKERKEINTTFGFIYRPLKDKIIVSAIYEGYEPDISGIEPGDEIYSINGIEISELHPDKFCEIYRKDYSLQNPNDTILKIEILKNDSILTYDFRKNILF